MKKILNIILLVFFVTFSQAQVGYTDNEIRQNAKAFFKALLSEKCNTVKDFSDVYCDLPSLEAFCFYRDSKKKNEITANADTLQSHFLMRLRGYTLNQIGNEKLEEILKKIDSTEIEHDHNVASTYVEIRLNNGMLIHLFIDEWYNNAGIIGPLVSDVFLNDGLSLNDVIINKGVIMRLRRTGIINDTDGYVNVREKGNIKSKVIGKIQENELFYYTPIGNCVWWPVSKKASNKPWGFMHKSRILEFKDFSKELKEKIRKEIRYSY